MMNMKEGKKTADIEMWAMKRIEDLYGEMLITNDPDYGIKIALQMVSLQSGDGSGGGY